MKQEQIVEKAEKIYKWMKLNPNNDWIQNTGNIWLKYMARRYNEGT